MAAKFQILGTTHSASLIGRVTEPMGKGLLRRPFTSAMERGGPGPTLQTVTASPEAF